MPSGSYSQTEAVAALHSFYEFFATLPSLDPADIRYPPPTGWPSVTTTSLTGLNKNEDVVDLLKHIPYITWDVQIAYQTHVIDYTGSDVQGSIEKHQAEGYIVPVGAGVIPEHIAILTMGGRYGSFLLVDTQEGTVTDYIQMEHPKNKEPPKDDPDYWRPYETIPIAEFFQSWIDNYRSLDWVTVPKNTDDGAMLGPAKKTDEVRAIYREYGWPDSFRREECRKALIEWDND